MLIMVKLKTPIILLASMAEFDKFEIWTRENVIGGWSVAMELKSFGEEGDKEENILKFTSYRPGLGVFVSIALAKECFVSIRLKWECFVSIRFDSTHIVSIEGTDFASI